MQDRNAVTFLYVFPFPGWTSLSTSGMCVCVCECAPVCAHTHKPQLLTHPTKLFRELSRFRQSEWTCVCRLCDLTHPRILLGISQVPAVRVDLCTVLYCTVYHGSRAACLRLYGNAFNSIHLNSQPIKKQKCNQYLKTEIRQKY